MYDYDMKTIERQRKRDKQKRIEINRRNMKFKKRRQICWAISGLLVLVELALLGIMMSVQIEWVITATIVCTVVILIALCVLQVVMDICPHCGSGIRRRVLWEKYCPHCGTTLEYSEMLDEIDRRQREEE